VWALRQAIAAIGGRRSTNSSMSVAEIIVMPSATADAPEANGITMNAAPATSKAQCQTRLRLRLFLTLGRFSDAVAYRLELVIPRFLTSAAYTVNAGVWRAGSGAKASSGSGIGIERR